MASELEARVGANRGYFGITDPDWYAYSRAQPRVDEVNFWQPHGEKTFQALQKGEPFFFKLRAPYKSIAGFGFFERYESMPAWLAWECFGAMNGAVDFETMIDRICRLRGDPQASDLAGEFHIGCIMISAPYFFEEGEWIAPPQDWAKTGIQQGKTYSLELGEGQRIYAECLVRARSGAHYWNVEPDDRLVAEGSARFGKPMTVKPRLGQGLFCLAVRDAYGGACAVTNEHSSPVLEAAHIKPYGRGGRTSRLEWAVAAPGSTPIV